MKLKKLAAIGLAVYALNKAAMPVMISQSDPGLDNPNIQRLMQTKSYHHKYEGNDQDISMQYLKLAHAITMKYMEPGDYPFGTTDDEKLESRVGNCTETSRFTYSNYIDIVKAAGRTDLLDNVRLARGEIKVEDNGGGHQWLEIYQNGDWKPYETVANDLPATAHIDPKDIDRIVTTESVMPDAQYTRTDMRQADENGNTKGMVDLMGILKSKGFAYKLCKAYQ